MENMPKELCALISCYVGDEEAGNYTRSLAGDFCIEEQVVTTEYNSGKVETVIYKRGKVETLSDWDDLTKKETSNKMRSRNYYTYSNGKLIHSFLCIIANPGPFIKISQGLKEWPLD